jgi:aryl-alcohol dehydrogenase-like predicted oxidoreductase
MKMKPLGHSDLMVSELCLGTMTWGKQNTEAEGHAQIDYALDQGLSFMDTAEVYAIPADATTYGRTETIIGTWFKTTGKRDRWVLATKVHGGGAKWIRNGRKADGASIREAVEGSLRRLQTDYIDLYQIHGPWRGHYHFEHSWAYAPHTQPQKEEILEVMRDGLTTLGALVKEGKIRHIGVSNESPWGIAQFLRIADETGLPRLVSVQNEYNLIRRLFDLDLAELSHHEKVGLLAYSPLAAGVLTGKYLDGQMPTGSRGDVSGGIWRQNEFSTPATEAYIDLARQHGLDIAQMAIAFCLTRPFMNAVIVGATSLDQLKTDIAARDIVLSPELLGAIDAVFRRFPRPI